MATFITSKLTGETINITVNTTTGYWKYNHNGVDFGPFNQDDGQQSPEVLNENGEFIIISCDDEGTISGDINNLELHENQITTFNGTGLSSLNYLALYTNQLTEFDGTGLSSLIELSLSENLLTTFNGTDLTSLTGLDLNSNQLTEFDGTGLTSLTQLDLGGNQLSEFDGTGLSNLTQLGLSNNQLTGLDISSMVNLTNLYFVGKDGSNPLTASANDSILNQFVTNGLENGAFTTIGGRTSAGTADYDTLISRGWTIEGADLVSAVRKLRVKGVGQLNP
jgi:hypothetical protein